MDLKMAFWGVLFALSAEVWADPLPAIAPSSSGNFQQTVLQLNQRLEREKKTLKAKLNTFHRIKEREFSAIAPWENSSIQKTQKQNLERLMEIGIKEQIRLVDRLEVELRDMKVEQAWSSMNQNMDMEVSNNDSMSEKKHLAQQKDFFCTVLPVEPQKSKPVQILQDFGIHVDVETGVQWPSSGWWVSNIQDDIRACADGFVAFSGEVNGRGHVIILDHGQGQVTLYGNLLPISVSSFLTKGARVRAGAILGRISTKVYFETRRSGEAKNPRNFFQPKLLSQLKIK